jgi:hypothetical protein
MTEADSDIERTSTSLLDRNILHVRRYPATVARFRYHDATITTAGYVFALMMREVQTMREFETTVTAGNIFVLMTRESRRRPLRVVSSCS